MRQVQVTAPMFLKGARGETCFSSAFPGSRQGLDIRNSRLRFCRPVHFLRR